MNYQTGLGVRNQSFDFLAIVQDRGDLSIRNLDNFIDILAHPQIVGDHDAGFSILMDQLRIGLCHLKGSLGVQAGSWLVSQDDAGVVDHRPGNGYALALAARELVGHIVHPLLQAQTEQ